MSKETPKDDTPRQTNWKKNAKQTDKPWEGPTEKEQRNESAPDLEKWHETNTH